MRMRSVILLIVVLAAAAVPLWYAFAHGYRSTTSYMCLRCRAVQHVTTLFKWKSLRIEETDYSRWFAKRQPTHTHQWGYCGTRITHYLISYVRGCRRQHPVWQIPPELQKAYVTTASVEQVEQFYSALDSTNGLTQSMEIIFPGTMTNSVSTNQFE